MVSLVHRHLAMLTFEVTLLDATAPVVISSQLLNRQDGEDEYHVSSAALGEGLDPRAARQFDHRVLVPRLHRERRRRGDARLPLREQRHDAGVRLPTTSSIRRRAHEIETTVAADLAKTVITVKREPGETIRVIKLVSYHSSTGRAGARAGRPLLAHAGRVRRNDGPQQLLDEQREWLDEFWAA